MNEPQPTECPKCGSRNRDYGDLISFGGVAFRSLRAGFFSGGKRVVAIACLDCGNVELVLEEVPRGHAARDERREHDGDANNSR